MSTVTKPIILDETGKAILAELRKFNSKNLQGPPGDPLTYDKLTLQQKRELAKPAADQVEALRQYIATLAASGDVDVALLQKVSSNAAAIDAIIDTVNALIESTANGEHPVLVQSSTTGVEDPDPLIDISDPQGFAVARFYNGHIKTEKFDSANTATKTDVLNLHTSLQNVNTSVQNTNSAVSGVQTKVTALETWKAEVEAAGGVGGGSGVGNSTDITSLATEVNSVKSSVTTLTNRVKTLEDWKDGGGSNQQPGTGSIIDKKTIKILCYGNSWSRDAFAYVPALIEDILGKDNVDVQFGIMYVGGCTIANHYSYSTNNSGNYSFDLWQTSAGVWKSVMKTFNYPLQNYLWDIILFQQQSSSARDYSTYTNLNSLIRNVFNIYAKQTKIGWHMTPPYNSKNTAIGSDTPLTMFNKIAAAAQNVLADTPAEFVMPSGAAIISAMTNPTISTLGDDGAMFDSAHGHLNDGIPCLLESYIDVLKIFELYGIQQKSIFGNRIKPTATWIKSLTSNGAGLEINGTPPTEISDDLLYKAQRIAIAAFKNPFAQTDCSKI